MTSRTPPRVDPLQQRINGKRTGKSSLQRSKRASEDVIAPLVNSAGFDGTHLRKILHHANLRGVAQG